ncbi:hypothetical protein [Microcystis phage Mel-JY01]
MYEYVEYILEKQNSDKILVINRKSGKKYYINKDRFDYRIHSIPPKVVKKKKEEPKKKSKSSKKKDTEKQKSTTKSSDKKDTDTKDNSEKESEKKEDTVKDDEPNLKKKELLGSSVFFNDMQQQKVFDFGKNIRADIKRKVLQTDLTFYIKKYNEFISFLKNGKDIDVEAIKNSVREIGKKVQKIALFKLGILSTVDNDPDVNNSTVLYKQRFIDVDDYLRSGKYVFSHEELRSMRDQLKSNPAALKDVNISEKDMQILDTIHTLDKHFESEGSVVNSSIIVYRAVSPDIINEFLKVGAWKDKSYVSTTLNPFLFKNFSSNIFTTKDIGAEPIIFRMVLPPSFNILFLSCKEDENCIESEIILPRNCEFFIHDKDKSRKVYTVSVSRGK